MKINKNSKVRYVGLSSFFALLALFGLAIFCPTSADSAQAITRNQRLSIDFVLRKALASGEFKIDFFLAEGGGINYESIAKALGIDFVIAQKITLSMSDSIGNAVPTETIQPTPSGQLVSGKTNFSTTTNSANGLEIYVYNAATNKLTGATTGNVINPTSSTVAYNSLANDTWGYNLSVAPTSGSNLTSLSYSPVATSKSSGLAYKGAGGDMQLAFAAKISTATNPDTYSNTVNVNVVPSATSMAKMMYVYTTGDKIQEEYNKTHPEGQDEEVENGGESEEPAGEDEELSEEDVE